MLSHRLLGLCSSLRFCWAVLVALVFFCGSSTWAITITITYESVGAEPTDDPNGTKLKNLAQYVADVYEDMIEDAHAMEFLIRYEVVSFTNGQFSHLEPNNATNRSTQGRVRINPTPSNDPNNKFYYDLTPDNDSEYDMQQKLFRDLSNLQQTNRFNGNTPEVFEAGYRGEVAAGAPMLAQDATDLLTILFHEMGHGLGLISSLSDLFDPNGPDETDDGDFDVNTNFVNGNVMALNVRDTDTGNNRAHVFGSSPENFAIMSGNSQNARRRPSATDLFAMASVAGWTNLDLRRQDFLGGGDWNTAGNWMGNQVPGSADAAFVRHGGTVTLSNNDLVASLLVDGDSRVKTDSHALSADDVTIQRTVGVSVSAIEVNSLGLLSADVITIGDNGLLFVEEGTVESREISIADGGQLRGYGTVNLNNAVSLLSNDGTIAATNAVQDLVITSSIDNIPLDLDGVDENGTLEALQGSLRFDTGLFDVFNSLASVGIARELEFGGGATIGNGGSVELLGNANATATLSGLVIFVSQGGSIVANDRGTVTAALILQTGSQVGAPLGTAHLDLNGQTTLNGGQITGSGLVIQNGPLFGRDRQPSRRQHVRHGRQQWHYYHYDHQSDARYRLSQHRNRYQQF